MERRYVYGLVFGEDEAQEIVAAIEGHDHALGVDEKERNKVGRHRHRIEQGETYFPDDLAELAAVLEELLTLWAPQTSAKWWREQGAPGADDAVEGLAHGRLRAYWRVWAVLEVVREAADELRYHGPPAMAATG